MSRGRISFDLNPCRVFLERFLLPFRGDVLGCVTLRRAWGEGAVKNQIINYSTKLLVLVHSNVTIKIIPTEL